MHQWLKHMRSVLPVVAFAALTVGASAVTGQTQQPEAPGPAAPRENAASLYPAGYSSRWIEDADFVYGPALLDFDLRAYVADAAPHLVRYAEFISHWCGYYSISPKVLLTVLELQSGLVSNSGTPGAMENPVAGLVAGTGFEAQVQNVLIALYGDFYAFRATSIATVNDPVTLNAATFALLNLFRASSTPNAFASSVESMRSRFLDTYDKLFPTSARVASARNEPVVAAVPPSDLLQLPWKTGQSWYFNGVHTNTGTDPGVMSSIDVVRTWTLTWGDDTSTDYVVAAHGGAVTVFSSCSVRVTSSTGWATNYYHLDNVMVSSGAQVTANQTLATYANSKSQALCQGGSSTGPHVHFSLLSGGVQSPLAGVSLGGFVVHPGRFSYDSNQSYMWLEKSAVKYYAYAQPILSTATSPRNLTLNDVTVSEGNSGAKNATFTVSLSASTSSAVTVSYSTADGTAVQGSKSNTSVISIPDSGAASPSAITMPAGLGTITKATAVLSGFAHTFPSDVDVLLAGPTGQTVMLMSDVGGGSNVEGLTLTFDDSGPALGSGVLASGTFKPTNLNDGEGDDTFTSPAPAAPYGSTLAGFNATNPEGAWRLFVRDDFSNDTGSFSGGWRLVLTVTAADYSATVGTLTISAGATSGTVAVPVNGDTTVEAAETFTLNLSNASGATITDGSGTATITNDDVSYTDHPLTTGTFIKTVHITELRAAINDARAAKGLAAFSFTDPTATAGSTPIKAEHITELRAALAQAYNAAKRTPPTYTDPTITAGITVVKAVHIGEIRAAVAGLP